jgi:hypothetical protein
VLVAFTGGEKEISEMEKRIMRNRKRGSCFRIVSTVHVKLG